MSESGSDLSRDPNVSSPREVLRSCFGYDTFREHQEEVVSRLVSGGDAFVLMPTGGGKSICYQIPAMLRQGVCVVVSPLISLMQDQVDSVRQLGVKAGFLNSSLDYDSARVVQQKAAAGELDLLYVAPERLLTESFMRLLDRTRIGLFAIDEAHCVSQWGHDFRPEYLKLSILPERFPHVPRVALTATADEMTRKEIIEKLHLHNAEQFISSFDRPNIHYRVEVKGNEKSQILEFLRSEHPGDSGIIYCMTRKKVEETARFLSEKGITALPYHAGLDRQARLKYQRRFIREEGVVMVATIAFGMGIDKPDVRFVAHLNLPKTLESYYQETGRAGRDGEKADAWMIYSLADVVILRQMLEASDGDEQFKQIQRRKMEAMLGYCETAKCRRQVLLSYFGEEMASPCGNCDTCEGQVETRDGTDIARKALQCVQQTGQMFGSAYLIDVLTGKESDRILHFRHDTVTTFGEGADLSEAEWKSVFRQLTAAGLLGVDPERRGGFSLTPEGLSLIRGERNFELRKDPVRTRVRAKRERRRAEATAGKERIPEPLRDGLWERLRSLRLEIAREQGVPSYVIFHDKTLKDLMDVRPGTLDEMMDVSGIGQRKLEMYGERFLKVLLEFETGKGATVDPPEQAPEADVAAVSFEPPEPVVDPVPDAPSSPATAAAPPQKEAAPEAEEKDILPYDFPDRVSLEEALRLIRNKPLVISGEVRDERLLRIRQEYRRAYEPWSEEEDRLLRDLKDRIKAAKALAVLFQRQPSAIRSRIQKLEGLR